MVIILLIVPSLLEAVRWPVLSTELVLCVHIHQEIVFGAEESEPVFL